jgi:hypothetical protein
MKMVSVLLSQQIQMVATTHWLPELALRKLAIAVIFHAILVARIVVLIIVLATRSLNILSVAKIVSLQHTSAPTLTK